MNLHITPSFIIDRLCKTASVLLFRVQNVTRGTYDVKTSTYHALKAENLYYVILTCTKFVTYQITEAYLTGPCKTVLLRSNPYQFVQIRTNS